MDLEKTIMGHTKSADTSNLSKNTVRSYGGERETSINLKQVLS